MSTIYREYVSDESFVQRLQNMSFPFPSEMHIAVAFARDYDVNMTKTDGIFKEAFDTSITPQLIANFKRNSPSLVKFYLCIGDRSQTYPFTMVNKSLWISNATISLTSIIRRYGFDGIDVFYPKINTNPNDFVDAIATLIDNLRMTERIVYEASLSTSHNVDASFYFPLYRRNPSNFEYVVYQIHDGFYTNPINNAQALIATFTRLAANNNYSRQKLLVGYSIVPKDWEIFPYPVVIATTVPQLVNNGNNTLAQGTSVWAVINEP